MAVEQSGQYPEDLPDTDRDRITFRLSSTIIDELDELVDEGVYKTRSHALRSATVSEVEKHTDRRIEP